MTSQTTTRRRVLVTGAGTISPLGDRPDDLWTALVAGRSGLRSFDDLGDVFDRDALLDRLDLRVAGGIPFDPRDYFDKNFRPVDRTGRLTIIAAERALEAAGWDAGARAAAEVGLVLGTMFGSLHTISAFDRRGMEAGPKYVKPLDFANSVINAAAGQTAIWLDLRGINSTVAGGTVAGLQAIAQACELLRAGRASALLAGGAEELAFESLFAFQKAGLLATPDASGAATPAPFAAGRNGFVGAEGAALLLLEDAESAEDRGAEVFAEVLGHGAAFDPSRGRDPERMADAAGRALRLALDDAGLDKDLERIDLVVAGGSGGVTTDAAEARGLAAALGDRLGDVPVLAPKSLLGESLGASGGFQALTLLGALTGHDLGPLVVDSTDPDLPPLAVQSSIGSQSAPSLGLATSVGFDGLACAVVLARR